jgi:5-(carboxyamino)imidazole ribonucleotide mutase
MKKKIMVILGSNSDSEHIQDGLKLLEKVNIPVRFEVISAHRHPEKLRKACMGLEKDGIEVVIACAGLAAALPGFIASYVNIPILGVAMKGGMLDGLDAVMSMVSMPKGTAVGCCGVGKSGFINACIVAMEIISLHDASYRKAMLEFKATFKQ